MPLHVSSTCSKHVEALNKFIVKPKFCASSWSITEINTRCGNKETGLLLLLISGHVDDEEEGRALTRGLPSTITQRFIHAHWLVWP